MNVKETPGFKIASLTRLKRQLMDLYLSEFGLSRTQWQVLIWLQILGNPSYQQDILKNIDIDAAHLTRVLEQLEDAQYITRTRVESNRRLLAINTTTKGKKIIATVEDIIEKETKILFAGFSSDEKKQFTSLLNRIEQNVLQALAQDKN
jgi:DNA-binding MarR family transcriptional regulator